MKMKQEDWVDSDFLAPLTRRRGELKFSEGMFIKKSYPEKKYYFKPKSLESAQFESYCAAIHRFNVTERYVPSYKAYKGRVDPFEEWFESMMTIIEDPLVLPIHKLGHLIEYVTTPSDPRHKSMHGVASKAIEFVSNFDDPLKEEDLLMKCQPFFNQFISTRIKKLVHQHIHEIEKSLKNRSFYEVASTFFSPTNPTNQLEYLKNIVTSLDSADTGMVRSWSKNPLCTPKLKKLLKRFIDQNTTEDQLELTIPLFELFDAQSPTHLSDKTLKILVDDKEYSLSSTLLHQYRLIKGLGRTLIMRSIFNDWDMNNSNFSKKGTMLDFEYSKMNVLMSGPFWHPYEQAIDATLKKKNITPNKLGIKEVLTSPFYEEASQFLGFEPRKWTPELISQFPDVGELDHYVHYHPSKRLYFSRVLFGIVTSLLIKCHKHSDSEIIQRISSAIIDLFPALDNSKTDPYYINRITDLCHLGFRTLKGVWSGEAVTEVWKKEQCRLLFTKLNNKWNEFYEKNHWLFDYAEMFLLEKIGSKSKTFSAKDNEVYQLLSAHPVFNYHKNISLLKYILTSSEHYKTLAELHINDEDTKSRLVEDEAQSLMDLKNTLIHTKEFQQFIMNSGDEAMKIILSEFCDTKTKYQCKLDEKPHFKPFIDTLCLEVIEQKYLEIKKRVCALNLETDEEKKPSLAKI